MSLSPYQMVQVRVSAWTSSGEGPLSDTSSGRSGEGSKKIQLYLSIYLTTYLSIFPST